MDEKVRQNLVDAGCSDCFIASYEAASYLDHDPKRSRKLLLHKKELLTLWNEVRQKGVTIIPICMYLKGGRAKLEIAVAKGKKLYDKRHDLAEKDVKRDLSRILRGGEARE